MKLEVFDMPEEEYENVWDSIGRLGTIGEYIEKARFNPLGQAVWRSVWVGVIAGAGVLLNLDIGVVDFSWQVAFGAAAVAGLEKLWRTLIKEGPVREKLGFLDDLLEKVGF